MPDIFKPNMSGRGVAWNTLVKAITLMFSIIIELFYTRFLLEALGTNLFGVISLTTNTMLFASILGYVILNSLGRFMIVDIYRNNILLAKKAFNTSFFTYLALSILVLSPVFLGIALYCNRIFIIPEGFENASRTLFGTVFFSFLLTSVTSVLAIGTFVYNRIDLVDLLNFGKMLVSRGLAVVLILFGGLGLYGISTGLFIASLLGGLGNLFFWRKLMPEIKISRKFWDKNRFHQMRQFASWIFLRQIGGRALVYLDLIVVNRLYGTLDTGLYAIAFFFSSRLRLLTGTFSGLFNPIIISRYSKNDINGMVSIACRAMTMIGIVFALPVGLLCGFYCPIFNVWVGEQYEVLNNLAIILTIHVSINTSCFPLFSILSAIDKVKVPSIITICFAFLNLILAIVLGWPGLGIGGIGVAIAGALTLTMNHAIFTPFYISHVLNRSPMEFYMAFIPGAMGMLCVFGVSFFVSFHEYSYSLSGLICSIIIISIIYLISSWFILIRPSERDWILGLINKREIKE